MLTGKPILRLLGGRTLWLFIAIMALVEAIYTAEEFTSLMEFIIANGGTVWDTLILAALRTPEVIDFALPIAIFVALYLALLAARGSNELVVCASAGVPWTRIPRFAFAVGLIGFCLSLLCSTFVTPLAVYTHRITASAIAGANAVRIVTEPGPKNSIRTFEGRTFIATPPEPGTDAAQGHLFIYLPDEGDGWRASQADDWAVVGPREDGSHAVQLTSYRDYIGRDAEQVRARTQELDPLQRAFQAAQWNVKNVDLAFKLEELNEPTDDRPRRHETILMPLGAAAFARLPAADIWQDWDRFAQRVGEHTARALLCVFAAFGAVAAAAWSSTRLGRVAAIPVSLVAVLGADLVLRVLLVDAARAGPASFAQAFCAAFAAAVLLPMVYVALRREALIVPRRGQG